MLNKMKQITCLFFTIIIICYPALRVNGNEKCTKIKFNTDQKVIDAINNIEVSIEFAEEETVDVEPEIESVELTEDDLDDMARYGDMEMLAQLVQAEAGNQDLTGMRYVAAVVLNRVDSDEFPDTVEGVIFQKNQFSVISDGAFDRAGWTVSEMAFEAVRLEYENRSNYDILYFSRGKSEYATHHFKHQDHWFGY